MAKPLAYRFIRCFDPTELRMVNIWQELYTLEQIEDCPRATEITVQAFTAEDVLTKLENYKNVLAPEVDLLSIAKECMKQPKTPNPALYVRR